MPHLARFISSITLLELKRSFYNLKRQATQQPYVLEIFLHINDPYSYLLVQALPNIKKRYNVSLRLRSLHNINHDMFPEPEMWKINAFEDALKLADLYSLSMPIKDPNCTEAEITEFTNQLVSVESLDSALTDFSTIFNQYWHQGDAKQDNRRTVTLIDSKATQQNEARLKKLGHYMSAMIYFDGEWYSGLDRLDHFEKRANQMGLSNDSTPTIYYNRTYIDFCRSVKSPSIRDTSNPNTLTLYFSIRSPYSHLGLERAVMLSEHYNIELIIKPVLPMVMRGLSVPSAKKMYIFHDTKREAEKYNIDYGFVADPLGAGVERCYALFEYATSKGKAVEYMLAYARAVNAKGIRSDTDKGLQKILSSCGLDWHTAKPLLNNKQWNVWAERNLQEMYSYGLWGVPSCLYKNMIIWGQDRMFVIENEILKDFA